MREVRSTASLEDVKSYWERHPLCSIELPQLPGTREFFEVHSRLRDAEVERYSKKLWRFNSLAGKRVLYVGCGPGWLVENYAAGRASVVGMDLTHRALALTRDRLGFNGLRAPLVQGDIQTLPFRDSSVDFVSCAGVLHHIPTPERGVSEIHRVLKPGGTAVLSVYYKNFLLRPHVWPFTRFFIRRLLTSVPGRRSLGCADTVETFVRNYDGDANPLGRAYGRAEALRLCRHFQVEKTEIHYFPFRFLPFSRLMCGRTRGLLDRFVGLMIFLVLRK